MTNLDELLLGDEPEENDTKKENARFEELHISRYAYEKAFRYAKLVIQKKQKDVEVGGFLTTPKNSEDRIARGVFLARDQVVSYGSYKLSAEDVAKAGKELEQEGQKIMGWWHSHGRLDTFHSKTDDENQMVLLNQISPSNYLVFPREKPHRALQSKVEGKNLLFWDPQNPTTKYQLELQEENPALVAQRLLVFEEQRMGFAYSFVVNWHRWVKKRVPYCEIATREICMDCKDVQDSSAQTGYRIFDEGEYKIDDEELLAEIDQRVHLAGSEFQQKKSYFLPGTFEEQRAAGTLAAPYFEPEKVQTSFFPWKDYWKIDDPKEKK